MSDRSGGGEPSRDSDAGDRERSSEVENLKSEVDSLKCEIGELTAALKTFMSTQGKSGGTMGGAAGGGEAEERPPQQSLRVSKKGHRRPGASRAVRHPCAPPFESLVQMDGTAAKRGDFPPLR